MGSAVVVALVGVAGTLLGALVKGAVDQRAATDEELRDARVRAYPWLWRCTAVVSHWPKGRTLSSVELLGFHADLRAWYFGLDEPPEGDARPGGLYLSKAGKDRYVELQDLIDRALCAVGDGVTVPAATYDKLRDSGTGFDASERIERLRRQGIVKDEESDRLRERLGLPSRTVRS